MAHVYSQLFALPTTGVRFFTVYGPWSRPDMALFLFTKSIVEDKPIQVFNNGEMKRDFTYVDDIVEGVFRVMHKIPTANILWDAKQPDPASSKAPYKIFNIGNNNPIKLMTFIEAIENEVGKKAIKEMMPLQKGDLLVTSADISDLIEEIDYKPSTNIETGVKNFVSWYRNYYKV
jgi:UDP-glucuronate 4-epimerase